MFDDLAGRKVLVTGSSTGIGAAVVKGFAAAGALVAVHCNRSREAARQVMADIETAGGQAVLVEGDVGRSAVAERVVDEAAAALGGLDVLVNNAGSMVRRARLAEIDDAFYDELMNLNVRSVVVGSRAALPHLRARGGGSIITTGSIAGRNGGGPGAGLYGSAKAFVQNFTRNLAKELATDNIRVNAVAPGTIMTPFHERYSTAEILDAARLTIPMQRLGRPKDCVGAYLFLASAQAAGYITGQVIEVNGGQLMP